MECPSCGGRGCVHCKKEGTVDIVDCPLELIDLDIWELLDLADLYKHGLAPDEGGSLDQAFSFVQCCRFVWSEEKYWKRKLKIMEF